MSDHRALDNPAPRDAHDEKESRRLRGKLGANAVHARGKTNTAPAREAWRRKVGERRGVPAELEQTDPEKYHRLLDHAVSAEMASLALKRQKVKKLRAQAEAVEAELQELGEVS